MRNIVQEKPQYRTLQEIFFVVTLNTNNFQTRNSEVKPSKSNVTGEYDQCVYVGVAKCRTIREKQQYHTVQETMFCYFKYK